MCEEETTSPSTSTSGTTRASKRGSLPNSCVSPFARMAEAEVLADRDVRRPQLLDEDPLDEVLGAALRERSVERDHDELLDAELRDQLRFAFEARQQLRCRLRADHGERVRFERQDRVAAFDDGTVAEVDTVELADRDLARAWLDVGQEGDLHGAEG